MALRPALPTCVIPVEPLSALIKNALWSIKDLQDRVSCKFTWDSGSQILLSQDFASIRT